MAQHFVVAQLEVLELADNLEAPPPIRRQRAFSLALDAPVDLPEGPELPPNQAALILQPPLIERQMAFVIPYAEM